jgi:acyl-CoA thioester hydrolase
MIILTFMGTIKQKIFNHLQCLLSPNQPFKTPLDVAMGKVIEEWIDYNGHMNMAYYVQCFEETSDYLLEHINLGYDYAVKENKGIFVIKCEINYRKEISLHESFTISVQSVLIQGKKMIVELEMRNSSDQVTAEYKILNLNVDLNSKKSVPFDATVINNLN